MIKKAFTLLLIGLALALVFPHVSDFFLRFTTHVRDIPTQTIGEAVRNIEKEILAPPPLRASRESSASYLTRAGVIAATNKQRLTQGLAALSQNSLLNTAAMRKVEDMFMQQYFAHELPTGEGPGEIVNGAGYHYILVGENLALGNFVNDQGLVQAWMDSPGHRANILHVRFQEIGVAVKKGMFEGKQTWLAVQEFGLPSTACPEPDAMLKARIETNEATIEQRTRELEVRRATLEQEKPKNRGEFNRDVASFNAFIEEYNNLIIATKTLVNQYNAQVQAFNSCAAG